MLFSQTQSTVSNAFLALLVKEKNVVAGKIHMDNLVEFERFTPEDNGSKQEPIDVHADGRFHA
jgi:hypothetical protein